jgi:hypothetical protein
MAAFSQPDMMVVPISEYWKTDAHISSLDFVLSVGTNHPL